MPELGEIKSGEDIGRRKGRLEQNKELKQEIRLLRWELKQRTSEIPEPSNHSVYEEAASYKAQIRQ